MLCACGCGRPTKLARQSDSSRGHIKGQPHRFVAGHNQRRSEVKQKYPFVFRPTHPRAKGGCIYEHVAIAEQALGRFLPDGAEIHHVNGDGHDNRNANLVICQDKAYHKLLHVRAKVIAAGGNPNTERICSLGRETRPLSDFNRMTRNKSYGLQSACRYCMEENRRRLKAQRRAVQSGREKLARDGLELSAWLRRVALRAAGELPQETR